MCGLAVMAGGGVMMRHLKAFQELLYVTALRGSDSTGVLTARTLSTKLRWSLTKNTIDAAQYLYEHARPGDELRDPSNDLFMAHCRSATVGKITKQNAHPFIAGKLIGMHNGTLGSAEFISPNKTDSQMMFEKMASVGIAQTLDSMTWRDAYAICAFDTESRKLMVARNNQRPLYLGIDQDFDVLFLSSEKEMLELVSKRNNIKLKVFSFVPNTLYSIIIPEIKKGNETPYNSFQLKQDEDWGLGYSFAYGADVNDKIPF